MKIKGNKVAASNIFTIVIPKADKDYVFQVGPANMEDFDKLCPEPEAPKKNKPGVGSYEDVNDKDYIKARQEWGLKRVNFMMIQGLMYTEGLEFEEVNLSDSDTWTNYQKELLDCGFTDLEISKILNKVAQSNGLNNEIIDKATEDFLAGQRQLVETNYSQIIEQNSMVSGAPANDSD